jgi:hypothetical protein
MEAGSWAKLIVNNYRALPAPPSVTARTARIARRSVAGDRGKRPMPANGRPQDGGGRERHCQYADRHIGFGQPVATGRLREQHLMRRATDDVLHAAEETDDAVEPNRCGAAPYFAPCFATSISTCRQGCARKLSFL